MQIYEINISVKQEIIEEIKGTNQKTEIKQNEILVFEQNTCTQINNIEINNIQLKNEISTKGELIKNREITIKSYKKKQKA